MEQTTEHQQRHRLLREVEDKLGLWHGDLAGVINFGSSAALPVGGLLADGVHRREGSAWQLTVFGGKIVKAVRGDMRHYLAPAEAETVHPLAPPLAPDEEAHRAGPPTPRDDDGAEK